MTTEAKQCRCPLRPYHSPGSFGSGSTHEDVVVRRWEEEHGQHHYAKARDELARAMESAERAAGGGEALLEMCREILGLPRQELAPERAPA